MDNRCSTHLGNVSSVSFVPSREQVECDSVVSECSSDVLEIDLTFFQSVWLSWVILFRAPAKVNNPKSFTSKFMTNIWACFCLAFTASYTANLAAFMITKDVYFDLTGITDSRVNHPTGVCRETNGGVLF